MRATFAVSEPFRELMRDVTAQLDWGDRPLTGPDAIESEHGSGGRIEGTDIFRFVVTDSDRRLEIELRVQQIRDIASGNLSEVDAQPLHAATGSPKLATGEPLLVWGEYDEDALRLRTRGDLALALDALQAISAHGPLAIRLWTALDDQVVCVIDGTEAALYVVQSRAGYGTSVGDPTRNEAMELADHDMGAITVSRADFVPWQIAKDALLHFSEHGALGDGVVTGGSLPSQFLMLGDFDRAAELESRRQPPVEILKSSLAEKAPQGLWARRLISSLRERGLVELDDHILGAINNSVALLLIQHGADAQESIERANALARDIERVRGIGALFATGGDLQIALRRTDPDQSIAK